MDSPLSLQLPHSFYSRSSGSVHRVRTSVNVFHSLNFDLKQRGEYAIAKNSISLGFLHTHYASSRWFPSRSLSSRASSIYPDHIDSGNGHFMAATHSQDMKFNRVNCLVWVIHESARSFSLMIESLELAQSVPELSKAWVGVDAHAWHKQIAYQVAVYALLKSSTDQAFVISRDSCDSMSLNSRIFLPKTKMLQEYIEGQLQTRHSEFVQWFRMVELQRISGFFVPLLKKWLIEYAESGVAEIIVAISCCAAVGKLGYGRLSCPLFTFSIEDVLGELMDLKYNLVLVDKMHVLATEAGFEEEFLYHFGAKVFPSKKNEEVEFWIGLALRKLFVAFQRESSISIKHNFHEKVQEQSLATLGLFAYLGRKTRVFLSGVGMKDLDEPIKDLLSFLESGILFIHPRFSSLSVYQHFMEVVIDEIEWFDFYADVIPCINNHEKRRSKHHTIQAEKEIVLSNVFTICYDVFAGFAHFSSSNQQPIDASLLAFLRRSQSLLTVCLEDYWAAYDRSGELLKVVERGASLSYSSLTLEVQQRSTIFTQRSSDGKLERIPDSRKAVNATKDTKALPSRSFAPKPKPLNLSLFRRSSMKIMSTSSDIWMGTQLLFIDIMVAIDALLKQLRGHNITRRERKKIEQTLADITSLIPITILMLLPVSVVGHAALLAGIKKYMPSLIPSPYSPERLDVVKQLMRTKKMKVETWSDVEE